MKRAVLGNMFKTAMQMCNGEEERCESRRLATQIACSNGYHSSSHVHHRRNGNNIRADDKLPLCLPFISDKISAAIQKCIVRAQLQDDIMLVNVPNDNIKKQLVRNRLYDQYCNTEQCVICPHGRMGDCAKMGVVYQLECLKCNARYIGETGRTLGIRIKEHLSDKRRKNLASPLGRHRHELHGGDDFDIKFTILTLEKEISARKALESFWISAKNPEMNNKNECLSITADFLPFLSLCEL